MRTGRSTMDEGGLANKMDLEGGAGGAEEQQGASPRWLLKFPVAS